MSPDSDSRRLTSTKEYLTFSSFFSSFFSSIPATFSFSYSWHKNFFFTPQQQPTKKKKKKKNCQIQKISPKKKSNKESTSSTPHPKKTTKTHTHTQRTSKPAIILPTNNRGKLPNKFRPLKIRKILNFGSSPHRAR